MSSSRQGRVIKADSAEQKAVAAWSFGNFDDDQEITWKREIEFNLAPYVEAAMKEEKGVFKGQFDDILEKRKKKKQIEENPPPTPEEILAEAEAQAQAIRDAAREEGYRAGHEQAASEVAEAVKKLADTAAEMTTYKPEMASRLEKELVELVKLAAAKVVGHELATQPVLVARVVKDALDHTRKNMWVKIHIHPDQLGVIEPILPELTADYPNLAGLELVADKSVESGGCILESEDEEIDASIKTRLEILNQIMDQALKGFVNGA